MEYPELPFFSFLAAVLVLIPLPWHWRARNIATVSLIIWLFLVDVVYGINSLIWNENVENAAPVWCDITSKIIVGASYALPLATLCICKHLEMVSSSRKVSFDYADRRHRMLFEAFMCFGLPAIFMALHYIVQGHRFDIFENTGCQAAVYISIPAILIIWLPQLLFSVVTMIYATIAIYHFIHRRLIFASHIQNTDSALTTNRYLRLIAMAFTEMIWCTTLTSYNLYNNITGGLRPWTTWADVHSNFLRVDQFLEMAIPPDFRQVMMLFWWAMPVSSFIFFIFFGFGEEARKEYIKIWQWSKESILRRSEKEMASSSTSGSPGLRPLKLVDQKNSTPSLPKISNPVLIFSSNPSLQTLIAASPTKPECQAPQLNTEGREAAIDISDTFSISTFSIYAQPHDLMYPYRSSIQGLASTTSGSDQSPPQLPEIPLSLPLSASPPPSPTPSVPESVGPTFYKSPSRPGCLPSPPYHRPFCGPSIYPTMRPHPGAQRGIMVTVHRQASVDEIV